MKRADVTLGICAHLLAPGDSHMPRHGEAFAPAQLGVEILLNVGEASRLP
jgi:hypothetical protein